MLNVYVPCGPVVWNRFTPGPWSWTLAPGRTALVSSTTEPETVLPALGWARAGPADARNTPSATTHPFVRQRLMGVLLELSVGRALGCVGRRAIPQGDPALPPSRALDERFSLSGQADGSAEGGQELAVDAPEPAVREDHHAVTLPQLAREMGHDGVHRADEPRVLATRLHRVHEVVLGQALPFRHLARQVGGGHDDGVRAFERDREVVLEHAGARGVRARLEDGEEAAHPRRRHAQRVQRLAHRGRMV